MKKIEDCKNINDIREQIDSLDKQIISLLGTRFQYVKEIVKYKEKTEESIVAADRRQAVLEQRRTWAADQNLNPEIIEQMYKNLIQYFIDEELKLIK